MKNAAGKINVMLVDDHKCLNEGLANLLNGEKDIHVCGMAANLEEASAVFAKTGPDVVLLDLNLGDNESGFTFLERVKSLASYVRVIIVSTFDGITFRNHAVSLGADDYVVKGSSVAEIVKAIRHSVSVDPVKPGAVANMSLSPQARRIQLFKSLSSNEKQVLQMLIDGKSQKEIACEIGVSASTVGTYVQRAREKLGARSLAHLISITETILSEEADNGLV